MQKIWNTTKNCQRRCDSIGKNIFKKWNAPKIATNHFLVIVNRFVDNIFFINIIWTIVTKFYFFFQLYIYTRGIIISKSEKEKEKCSARSWKFSDFIIFFQRQKKIQKKTEIFYTVVMCSLLIFLCICRLYIIVTKNKRNNNYYYYCYMVLYENYIWKNIKALFIWCYVQKKETIALFFQLSYLSLREIRKYTNFPIGQCYGCYPQIIYLWVPIVA